MDEKIKKPDEVKNFWQEFCETGEVKRETPYQVWCFGNTAEMAEELLELVLEGKKAATAGLVWAYETEPEGTPVLNGYSVITDFEGNPKCVIQTTEIRVLPFNEVDAEFAFDEGEGDQSLDHWRQVHWEFFSNVCLEIGREPEPEMLVKCERFKLLYP
jgi:uncharacterized protein YhfF